MGRKESREGVSVSKQTYTPVPQVTTVWWAERLPPPSVTHKAKIHCADRVCLSMDVTRAFGIFHNCLKGRGHCSGPALLGEGERVFPVDCELTDSECWGNVGTLRNGGECLAAGTREEVGVQLSSFPQCFRVWAQRVRLSSEARLRWLPQRY